ncbi:antitoxin Xre/MbcA/ParS toxin-binding domain-containing protein [Massilia sp. GER05]|uniref:antitoxin Xre/MbcA/ParS toxin-binding domain-containing protein n=1 Tax=Massilia sp. GER05 TaxID=3394605 RepID=UPI003F877A5C
MNTRNRKRRRYFHLNRAIRYNVRKTYVIFGGNLKIWNAISPYVFRVFGNDYSAAWDWFTKPALAFNGMRPADLVQAGEVQLVREHLLRMEYCVYT